jgi:hypothetical protein
MSINRTANRATRVRIVLSTAAFNIPRLRAHQPDSENRTRRRVLLRSPAARQMRALLWLLVLAGGVRTARAQACVDVADVAGRCTEAVGGRQKEMYENGVLSGSFSELDDPSTGYYYPLETCTWEITARSNQTNIVVDFVSFDTEIRIDLVRIYDCVKVDCLDVKKHGRFSMSEWIWQNSGSDPSAVTTNSSHIVVGFFSDRSVENLGFTAEWSLQFDAGGVACECNVGYGITANGCQQCALGTFKDALGNFLCTPCIHGTYSDVFGATVCKSCQENAGTYQYYSGIENYEWINGATSKFRCACNIGYVSKIIDGTEVCEACAAGTYDPSVSAICQACPAGTFSSDPASTACETCVVGTFSLQGQTECTSCAADSTTYDNGFETTGASSFTYCLCNAGYEGNAAANIFGGKCTECNAGYWKSEAGNVECTACTAGKYSETSAATSLDTCTACESGTYQDSGGATTCSPCQPGTYNDKVGQTECDNCEVGKYSSTSAAESSDVCMDCPPATYQTQTGQSECTSCPEHMTTYFNFGVVTGQTSNENCKCNRGYGGYATTGACTACPAGKYKAYIATGDCAYCGKGTYQDKEAASTCNLCELGKYADDRESTVCTSCGDGTTMESTGADSIDRCLCNKGYGAPSTAQLFWNSLVCRICGPGTYSDQINRDPCYPCAPGKYQPAAAASQCDLCGVGTYAADSASTVCTSCVDGATTYDAVNQLEVEGADSAGFCQCNKGYGGPNTWPSLLTCTPCERGKYSNQISNVPCQMCGHLKTGPVKATQTEQCYCITNAQLIDGECKANVGYAAILDDDIPFYISVAACESGHYKDQVQNQACYPCAPGRYQPAAAASNCDKCVVGTYASEASSACTPCVHGASTYNGQREIEETHSISFCKCNAGFAGNAADESGACQECTPGSYTSHVGLPSCMDCPAGQYSDSDKATTCSDCQAGTYTNVDAQSVCIECVAGKYGITSSSESESDCQVCDLGYYAENNASTKCLSCAAGTYASSEAQSVCQPCPVGKVSNVSASTTENDCESCARGQTSQGNECQSCGYGFHEVGGACIECPGNKTTLAEGSFDAADCVCAAGEWGDTECATCPAGSHSAAASLSVYACFCNYGYTGDAAAGGGGCGGVRVQCGVPLRGWRVCRVSGREVHRR